MLRVGRGTAGGGGRARRGRRTGGPGDLGVSLYLEYLGLLVVLVGIVLAVAASSVPHDLSCLVERAVVTMRAGGGQVCGERVDPTPVPDGSSSPTPGPADR